MTNYHNIDHLYELYIQAGGQVTTDSRNCPQESIFFALKGENFNGNLYAQKALESGCAYAVVDQKEYATNDKCLLVEDTLVALQDLARHHRIMLGKPIIGITGTNGKTTTKELVAAVLKQRFNVHYTQGNLNNHIGVPLTLLQMTAEHQIGIIEMGANHPGEIKTLTEIACPNVGIITNIGKAHLEGFGSLEGVISTKKELYDFISANQGFILRNADNDILSRISGEIPSQTYSLHNQGNMINATLTSQSDFLQLSVQFKDAHTDIQTHLIGAYNAENALAAVTVGATFGLTIDEIKSGLEGYLPQNNRSMLVTKGTNKIVVDAYNANPTSMQAAIENFINMGHQKPVYILGDMLELGEHAMQEHAKIVELLGTQAGDVYLVGKHFGGCSSPFHQFEHTSELCNYLQEHPINDSYILLKGSRGIRLETVLDILS